MGNVKFDTMDGNVRRAGRRCKDCDRSIYDEDTSCKGCGSMNIVMPYPPATTLEQAVANVFEHDSKRSMIVAQILSGEWDETHGVEALAGAVASQYQGEDPGHEACMAAVRRGLAQKRTN